MEQISLLCLLFMGSCTNANDTEHKVPTTEIVTRQLQEDSTSRHLEEIAMFKNKAKLTRPEKHLK